MKKVLAYLIVGATLTLTGCFFDKKRVYPETSVLEKLPFVYKMTVNRETSSPKRW